MDDILHNLNEAAAVVLEQASAASNQTTFAVGGLMVNNVTHELIYAIHNNVMIPLSNGTPFTFDPTAHGERQLVNWYYQNKQALGLPEPGQITVITSLDPCVMCTGALLTAGFNVGVAALDTYAGINYQQNFEFTTLPPDLREQAKQKFGYFASGPSRPATFTREYVGGPDVAFKDGVLTPSHLLDCGQVFSQSADNVRSASNSSGAAPSSLTNPALLPPSSAIIEAYRAIYPKAFSIKIPNSRLPDQLIFQELQSTMAANPAARNAVAFIDPFGNLVLCLADTPEVSPINTAFMNVTRAYAQTRWTLSNEYAQNLITDDPANYLTHPKYGTFVFLYAPDPADSTTVMTLGAYGSSMEGPIPNVFPANLQFFFPPRQGSFSELVQVVNELPPFYTQSVNISMMQVPGSLDTAA